MASGERNASEGEKASTHEPATVARNKIAQIGGRVGELPHQPDNHHLLKVGAQFFQGRDRVDGPETGAAKPEIKREREPPERAGSAHAARLKNGRNSREQHQQTGDAGHIAQRLAEIEGVLPGE